MSISVIFSQVSCLSDCGSASTNSTQNRKYCAKPLLPNYSNCDCLTLSFFTNSSDTTRGFEFRYEITSPGKWPVRLLKPDSLLLVTQPLANTTTYKQSIDSSISAFWHSYIPYNKPLVHSCMYSYILSFIHQSASQTAIQLVGRPSRKRAKLQSASRSRLLREIF